MRERIFRDAAEQKTADQIDYQSAVRETGACAFLHQTLQSVARKRARRAKHNQQESIARLLLVSYLSYRARSNRRFAPTKKLLGAGGGQESSVCPKAGGRFRRTPSPFNCREDITTAANVGARRLTGAPMAVTKEIWLNPY